MTERVTIRQGDALTVLREMEAESVHCAITSPPYFGLRDYCTAEWEGGDPDCDHQQPASRQAGSTLTGGKATTGHAKEGYRARCAHCNAQRVDQQIGLEASPEEWVARLVEVFREVRRVLRRDGTLWLNVGDAYAGGKGQSGSRGSDYQNDRHERGESLNTGYQTLGGPKQVRPTDDRRMLREFNIKPKDLIGLPWMLAFAFRADGWYLRSDVIWSKPNPMPESVTDRPTKSHEYLFLLAKSATYYYDAEAIREQAICEGVVVRYDGTTKNNGHENRTYPGANGPRDITVSGRNKRTVWTICTEPYPEAHFATFPTALVKPCILAGTSERGCCPNCGAGWVREVKKGDTMWEARKAEGEPMRAGDFSRTSVNSKLNGKRHNDWKASHPDILSGWRPSCNCGYEDTEPCTVLDPFAGSGTTGLVALQYGRRFVGIELNADYCEMASRRLAAAAAQEALGL